MTITVSGTDLGAKSERVVEPPDCKIDVKSNDNPFGFRLTIPLPPPEASAAAPAAAGPSGKRKRAVTAHEEFAEGLKQLVEMGFEEALAKGVLEEAKGDVATATGILMGE